MPRNDLKAYTSLIARIPQDLADQVKRYAREHRSTVSELIRDGLEMRLDTDLPWHAPGTRRDATPEVLPEVLHALEALTPMLRTLVQDTVRESLSEVLQEVLPSETSRHTGAREVSREVIPDNHEVLHEVLLSGDRVLHGHTSTLQPPSGAPNGGMTEVAQGHTEVIPQRPTACSTHEGITRVIPSPAPLVQAGSQGMTEVVPPSEEKRRGRPPVLRPGILALLDEHPAGLTAAELKVYLGTEKHIGDTLSGMVKAQLLVKSGTGQGLRYQLAIPEAPVEAPSRP